MSWKAGRRARDLSVFSVRRMLFLLCLALIIGLVLVYLRTQHIQMVYEIVNGNQQEQQLSGQLWVQQMHLSGALDSPERIKEQIEQLKLEVSPPGIQEEN